MYSLKLIYLELRQKKINKQISYKLDGTDTAVLSPAISSIMLRMLRCSNAISHISKQQLYGKTKKNFFIFFFFIFFCVTNCAFSGSKKRSIYQVIYNCPRINKAKNCLNNSIQRTLSCFFKCIGLYLCFRNGESESFARQRAFY